jgi:hypothetical protein
MRGDSVEHSEEILDRHILIVWVGGAVAPTVATVEVTAQRTLPKERAKWVLGYLLAIKFREKFEPQLFAEPYFLPAHSAFD